MLLPILEDILQFKGQSTVKHVRCSVMLMEDPQAKFLRLDCRRWRTDLRPLADWKKVISPLESTEGMARASFSFAAMIGAST